MRIHSRVLCTACCLLLLAAATAAAAEPFAPAMKERAGSFLYGRLGYGALSADPSSSGASLGIGWRSETESFAIDLAAFDIVLDNDGTGAGWDIGLFKLAGLFYFSPQADASLYFGFGVGYGGTSYAPADPAADRVYGLRGELSLGMEAMRTSNLRFILQLNATLPFYKTGAAKDKWIPVLGLSVGAGF